MTRRDDLLEGPKDRAIAAIKSGEKEEAIQHVEELYQEFKPLHDRYAEWIQCLLCFIADKLGEEAVEEALRKTYTDVYKDILPSHLNQSPEELIKWCCRTHRLHYSECYVEEDDEKFTLFITYCGSGSKIQEKYKSYGRSKKAAPWTANQKGLCYYCAHEPVFKMAAREIGRDTVDWEAHSQFDAEGRPTGQPCKWVAYKER